ncbi:hypothetical protein [Actinomadura sp. 6N118]|uniref:hypothetical protein n=1 Tax=Actinomadura sp. 6N118 TaxID=3375151 RepID=UPI0037BDD756
MDEPPRARSAVLVVYVWLEAEAADGGFRARVTSTPDAREPGESTVVTDPAQLMELVGEWLARSLEGG